VRCACQLGAWTDADWRREDRAGLLEYAEEETGGFTSEHPLGQLRWRYVPAYSLARLTKLKPVESRRAWTARSWQQWYATERKIDGREGYYDGLENDWTDDPVGVGPVIIVENPKEGWFDVGDGWHRIGASFKLGLTHIPAVVGTYR
jgi:hypothetical protein